MDFRDTHSVGDADVATVIDAPVSSEKTDSKSRAVPYNLTADPSRDALLTDFGKETLKIAISCRARPIRISSPASPDAYADDQDHAQRLYGYISNLWFMPATPVLSNGGTNRGLPISCYLNSVEDSLEGIVNTWNENVWLASRGGGIGTYWGNVRGHWRAGRPQRQDQRASFRSCA